MCIALVAKQRDFADTGIRLAQRNTLLLGQAHQMLAGAGQQFGVGREGNGLWLYRSIDDHAGEVGRLCGAVQVQVQVAAAKLSCNNTTSFSSPMRLRQRVIEERSNGNLWRKNSSPQKY